MTNKNINMLKDEADIHPNTSDSETIGSLLRQSRESMGASVADIADKLHIRPCIVEDIEADKFDQIASPIFVKGYINNFAHIVQADDEAIKRCLINQVPQVPEPQMQSFSRKTTLQARDGRLMFVTYLIAFILLALLVLWWVQKPDVPSSIDFSKLTAEEIAASQSESDGILRGNSNIGTYGILSGNIDTDSGNADIENLTNRLNKEDTASTELSAPETSESISLPVSRLDDNVTETETDAVNTLTQSVLSLNLSADCWINVTDAAGKVLVNDLKKAGSQLNVSGEAPFKLIIGAPQAVNIEFNGEAVSLADFPSGRVARLTVPVE
ncbi:MAG: RodZ domain-containing protein [Shewanella sp.]